MLKQQRSLGEVNGCAICAPVQACASQAGGGPRSTLLLTRLPCDGQLARAAWTRAVVGNVPPSFRTRLIGILATRTGMPSRAASSADRPTRPGRMCEHPGNDPLIDAAAPACPVVPDDAQVIDRVVLSRSSTLMKPRSVQRDPRLIEPDVRRVENPSCCNEPDTPIRCQAVAPGVIALK